MMNNSEVKNITADMETMQLPISLNAPEIFESATGSASAPVNLYIRAVASILTRGTVRSSRRIIIPKIPRTLLIDDIQRRNSSTVSEVNPPTIGMKLLMEYLAVLINIPSDVSVRSPCILITPVIITRSMPTTATEAFLISFASLFT